MSVLDLGAGEGCSIDYKGVPSGYAHAFSASDEKFVLLGGFDETPSAEDEEPTDGSGGGGGGGGCAVAGSDGGGTSLAAVALLLAVLLGRGVLRGR